MKFSTNLIAQIVGVIIQAANQFGSMIPAEYQPFVALIVGVGQALVAFLAHFRNPDGTPAAVAFIPKK